MTGALVPKALVRYAPLLILAMAWETASRLHLVSSLALPPLTDVAEAWVELVQSGELVTNGLSSLYRAGAGLALAIMVGGALGIFMASSRPVNALLGPLVELLGGRVEQFYALDEVVPVAGDFGAGAASIWAEALSYIRDYVARTLNKS